MILTIYRVTESFGRGDPSDGSETWESESSIIIVTPDESESFADWCVGHYEDQDYSYRFKVTEIAKVTEEEAVEIAKQIGKREFFSRL